MIYLKSALAGLMAAIVTPIMYVVCRLLFEMLVAAWSLASASTSGGIAGVSAGIDEGPILLLILAAFVGASIWTFRRLSRKRATG